MVDGINVIEPLLWLKTNQEEATAEDGNVTLVRSHRGRPAVFVTTAVTASGRMMQALDNLVGTGAQHENTCDQSEHGPRAEDVCIYCEAREALALAQFGKEHKSME